MRKCKFIGKNYRKEGDWDRFSSDKIYYYEISNATNNDYPYHIYNGNKSINMASFSKPYFDCLFIDLKEERKQKINKLCKNVDS